MNALLALVLIVFHMQLCDILHCQIPDQSQIGSIDSVLCKLPDDNYTNIYFCNLQYLDGLKKWQRILLYPNFMRSNNFMNAYIVSNINWVIRADILSYHENVNFTAAFEKYFPEPESIEFSKILKKTGPQLIPEVNYLVIIDVDNIEAFMQYLLKSEYIQNMNEHICDAKLFKLSKNPFETLTSNQFYLINLPFTNEIAISTSTSLLTNLGNSRDGKYSCPDSDSDKYDIFDVLSSHINDSTSWSISIGQDKELEVERVSNLFSLTKEKENDLRNRIRSMIPIGRVHIMKPNGDEFLDRLISIWDLSDMEVELQAIKLVESQYRSFSKWANDVNALKGIVKSFTKNNCIYIDINIKSEYQAWALASSGFEYLDHQGKRKKTNGNNLPKEEQ